MAALGAGLGAVGFALLWLLVPRRTSLLVQLARFDARPGSGPERGDAPRGGGGRLGILVASWLARRGISYPSLRQDLTLTGRTFEEVMARKVLSGAGGFVLVVIGALLVRVDTPLRLPAPSPLLLATGTAAGLFFVPDLQAHRQARLRRREFTRALGAWLDLVALEMAGSAAPAEALPAAARVSTGWPMIVLSDTLYRATAAGQEHWQALIDLGQRIAVPELIDLATVTRLVGRDGARVRDTLTARAATMRRALLAQAESRAGRQDQSMLVAQILIGLGFVIFLMYPALVNVMSF